VGESVLWRVVRRLTGKIWIRRELLAAAKLGASDGAQVHLVTVQDLRRDGVEPIRELGEARVLYLLQATAIWWDRGHAHGRPGKADGAVRHPCQVFPD